MNTTTKIAIIGIVLGPFFYWLAVYGAEYLNRKTEAKLARDRDRRNKLLTDAIFKD